MEQTATSRVPTWFSGMLLVGLTAWLLVLRPGQLAPTQPFSSILLFTNLAIVYVLYLVAWNTHGIIYSMISISIFLICERPSPATPQEAVWQFLQIAVSRVARSAANRLVRTEQNRQKRLFLGARLVWTDGNPGVGLDRSRVDPTSFAFPAERWLGNGRSTYSHVLIRFFRTGRPVGRMVCARRNASTWIWGLMSLLAPITSYLCATVCTGLSFSSIGRRPMGPAVRRHRTLVFEIRPVDRDRRMELAFAVSPAGVDGHRSVARVSAEACAAPQRADADGLAIPSGSDIIADRRGAPFHRTNCDRWACLR